MKEIVGIKTCGYYSKRHKYIILWDECDPDSADAYKEVDPDDIYDKDLIAKFKETWKVQIAQCDNFVCPEHYDRVSDILSQGYVSHGRTRVPSIAASEPVSKRSKENGDDDKDKKTKHKKSPEQSPESEPTND